MTKFMSSDLICCIGAGLSEVDGWHVSSTRSEEIMSDE